MHETMLRAFEASGGLSSADLARAINESPQNVTNWGKRGISKAGAIKVANVFGVSVDWLLTGVTGVDLSRLPAGAVRVEEWDDSTPLDDDEFEVPFFKDFLVSCGSGTVQEALQNERRKRVFFRLLFQSVVKFMPKF